MACAALPNFYRLVKLLLKLKKITLLNESSFKRRGFKPYRVKSVQKVLRSEFQVALYDF